MLLLLGVGAMLSHIIDGKERPIAFSSKTMSSSESNYSQIEKDKYISLFNNAIDSCDRRQYLNIIRQICN